MVTIVILIVTTIALIPRIMHIVNHDRIVIIVIILMCFSILSSACLSRAIRHVQNLMYSFGMC